MAGGITGMGTTFNLPNYVGELYALSREDTPFLSAIGGLMGDQVKFTDSTLFQWQTYDLRSASANNVAAEGADAPTAVARVRGNVTNVVEIHHSAVDVSYTKLAAIGQQADVGSSHTQIAGVNGSNPVVNESAWQIEQELKAVAHDINESFLNGSFQEPSDNNTNRQTRGLLEAITTNATDANGVGIDDTGEELVEELMQDIYDNGGIREGDTRVLLTNSTQKRKLTKHFITDNNYREQSRNVGGVNVTSVETDFGVLNIMLEPALPQDEIAVVSMGEIRPVFMLVPEKGFLFVEPLAKVGASERSQIYGEVGLEYGVEKHHGKLTDLGTAFS